MAYILFPEAKRKKRKIHEYIADFGIAEF